MILAEHYFQGVRQTWNITLKITQNLNLFISAQSTLSLDLYETLMTSQQIQNDKLFGFFFQNALDLFKFLSASFQDIILSEDGTIMINMTMPVGKINKQIQFKIPMTKKQIDFLTSLNLKVGKLTKFAEQMRQENALLQSKIKQKQQKLINSKDNLMKLQKIIDQKDEVINSIFSHLRQLSKWKQQKQKIFIEIIKLKRPFIPDETNSHNVKFANMGNRFKKITGGSWDLLINKNQIENNSHYRYHIKQIKSGSNGSFMYGIGTEVIKGISRAQDNKEFIGYYENTGNVYDRGESKKGGRKIKQGQVVTIDIDTKNWKISWLIQGILSAQTIILGQFRHKPFYLAIIIYNEDSQIEFM